MNTVLPADMLEIAITEPGGIDKLKPPTITNTYTSSSLSFN